MTDVVTNHTHPLDLDFPSLVPRLNHAHDERIWGLLHRFLVLQTQQSCDHLHRCILALAPVLGAHDKENAPMSPDPFPSLMVGSGNETKISLGRGEPCTVEPVYSTWLPMGSMAVIESWLFSRSIACTYSSAWSFATWSLN